MRLASETRQATRGLLRQRGSSIVAIVLLLLACGTAGTMYSVLNVLLWERHAVDAAEELAVLWRFDPRTKVPFVEISFLDYSDWRRDSESFSDLACFGAANHHAVLLLDEPHGVDISDVSVSFFDVLGSEAAIGRTFSPSEGEPDSDRVVVISHGLWQRIFAGEPGILERSVRIQTYETHLYRVIGVMPKSFAFPLGVEMWMPLRRDERFTKDRFLAYLFLVGRLAEGVDLDEAKAEMDTLIAATDTTLHPDRARENVASVRPYIDYVLGDGALPALAAMSVAVLLIVLIAWLNVFNLLLVRLKKDEPERAIRRALGASSWDLAFMGFVDIAILAILACFGAIGLEAVLVQSLRRFGGPELPRLFELSVQSTPVIALAAVSIVVLGSLAALRMGRDGKLAAPRRPRQLVLSFEVAIAVVVLAASGLTMRSFMRLSDADPGYRAQGLLTFDLVARDDVYPELDDKRSFHRRAIDAVRTVAGVRSVAGVLQRPFRNGAVGWDAHYVFEGQAFGWQSREHEGKTYHIPRYDGFNANPTVNWEITTPGYFDTMGIDVLEGRDFRASDRAESPRVVIINKGLADLIWPEQPALGKGLIVPGSGFNDALYSDFSRVIGIVEDAKYREIDVVRYDIYTASAQSPLPLQGLVVRTEGDPMSVLPAIRNELQEIDRTVPLTRIALMDDVLAAETSPWRFNAALFATFAVLASVMTAIGIVSLVARSVTGRRREIGIRLAIGAHPGEVISLFVRRAMRPAVTGITIGIVAALVSSRFIESLLFGVDGTDPATYAAVAVLFLLAALLASYIPARKASLVHPTTVLRHD